MMPVVEAVPINSESAMEVISQIDRAIHLLRPVADLAAAFGSSEGHAVVEALRVAQATVARAGIGVHS